MFCPYGCCVLLNPVVWQVLERGQEISKREWKLIRVAIVDIKNSTYIGRLFFGDKETGEVVWDCDCRPSDGLWLSHQVHANSALLSSNTVLCFCNHNNTSLSSSAYQLEWHDLSGLFAHMQHNML